MHWEIELVATVASLFHDSRVDPRVERGEDLDAARARVKRTLENDVGLVLLLQMLHPESLELNSGVRHDYTFVLFLCCIFGGFKKR
jgi:hypothetical protein